MAVAAAGPSRRTDGRSPTARRPVNELRAFRRRPITRRHRRRLADRARPQNAADLEIRKQIRTLKSGARVRRSILATLTLDVQIAMVRCQGSESVGRESSPRANRSDFGFRPALCNSLLLARFSLRVQCANRVNSVIRNAAD